MKFSQFALSLTLLIALVLIADAAFAQPPPPSLPNMPNQAPIDGGLGLLAASGAAYAWRRLRSKEGA